MAIDTGLVQNRLTIAGFILALFVFVASILLSFIALAAQALEQAEKTAFIAAAPWDYINTVVPVFLGFLFAIFSIVLLLQSQATGELWLLNLGEIVLYLALSQFLSSGLNKIINVLMIALINYGVAANPIRSYLLIAVIKGLPLLMWLLLLFGAPLNIIIRAVDKRKVIVGYTVSLTVIFFCSALAYSIREKFDSGFFTFIKWCLWQPVQPIFW